MAPTTVGKVSPGDPLRAPPAVIWNGMIDAGLAFAEHQLSSSAPPPTRARSTDLVKLKNSSGDVRRKGEILKIDGKVIERVSDEFLWLDGYEPTLSCRFGILRAPATDGEVVSAQVSGVGMALVLVTDANHTHAYPVGSSYVLRSGNAGPVEIVYAPDGTGELECVVRFVGGPGVRVVWITETGEDDANKAFAATLDADTCVCNTAEDSSGDEITVQIKSSPGVVFTMQRIIVIEVPDGSGGLAWELLTAGTAGWIATAQTAINPDGTARLQYQVSGGTRTCDVPTTLFDTTFNVSAGRRIDVRFEQSTGLFYTLEAACPVVVEY